MSYNDFENKGRYITETDVALAKAYYPMLIEKNLINQRKTACD